MESLIIKFGLSTIGMLWLVWGGLIVMSDQFFHWWQERYWREAKGQHKLFRSVIYNRYGTGGGMLILGAVLIYSVLY
jgi:hypothetical protein